MNVLTVSFEDVRQITYFCNEIESYGRRFKCKLKAIKGNSVYSSSLSSILKIGINTPFDIVIESHDGNNTENVKKCKEEIERWFNNYGNDNEN